jgi:coronin-1B/1C/6
MLYTCQNNQIHFWDYSVGKKLFSMEHSPSGQCLSNDWCVNYADGYGDIMVTGSTDKMARMWDIRQNRSKIAEVEAHASLKPYTVLSVGRGSSLLFSVGFSKSGQREFVLWDRRDFSKELQRLTIDNGASITTPFYDNDIHVLYLVGKGDGNIR